MWPRNPISWLCVCGSVLWPLALGLQTYADDVSSYSSIQGLTFEEDARCSKCDVPLIANCNFCQNCGNKVNIDGAFASRREFQSGYT